MFETFAKFDKILVSGPQRSGTRVCARMIAHDLGHHYIDENDLDMDSLYILCSYIEKKGRYVVQCPTLCRYIHIFDSKNTAVILMRRDIKDIIASQKRIDWRWEWLELARYDRTGGVIAEVKYRYWEEYQKKKIKNAFEIEYESLKSHPLWIPGDLRRDFKADQTWSLKYNPQAIHHSRPTRDEGIFCCEHRDAAVLVKTTQVPKRLNATGLFTWNLCDGRLTYREILQKLKDRFHDVDETKLAGNLDTFINNLLADGFLRLSPADAVIPANRNRRKPINDEQNK